MKKTKKFVSLLCAMVMVLVWAAPVGAAEEMTVTYNSVLEKIGITEDVFWSMPAEKQALYQGIIDITDITTDTKYFHEVCDKESGESTLYEVSADQYADRGISVQGWEVTDEVSGNWYVLTTFVGRNEYNPSTPVQIPYSVGSTLEVDRNELYFFLAPVLDTDAYLGISINANMSPVSGSEYCSVKYTHLTGPNAGKEDSDTIQQAQHKGYGYAFDFLMDNANIGYEITMGFGVVSNTTASATVVDAYGFAGYWGKVLSVSPSIDIGASGVGISISPAITNAKHQTLNTHAQLFV